VGKSEALPTIMQAPKQVMVFENPLLLVQVS